MPDRKLTVTVDNHVAIVEIDNPPPNVLDEEVRNQLSDAIAAANDSDDVRCLVITGTNGVFATGLEPPPESKLATDVASAIAASLKPTIAWVDGECHDMGLELALACDIRVCSANARFAIRYVGNGGLPWNGGTQRLTRLVGRGQTLRLLLTGVEIDADEALRIGLVEHMGTREDADALAAQIVSGAPIAARYAKEAANAGLDVTLEQGLRLEADLSVLLQSTDDRAEGLRSFKDKDEPEYHGR